jgi:antitoxin ParD1/3/4
MSTFQIMLSEPLQQFVLGQVAELGLDRPDQYFEQLLEDERQRKLEEYYLEKCREGLASGPPIPITPGYWHEIIRRIERKFEKRQRKAAE